MQISLYNTIKDVEKDYKEDLNNILLNSLDSHIDWYHLLDQHLPNYKPLYFVGIKNEKLVALGTGYNVQRLDLLQYSPSRVKKILSFLNKLKINLFKFNVVFLTNPMSNEQGIRVAHHDLLDEFISEITDYIYTNIKPASIFVNNISDADVNIYSKMYNRIPFYPNTVLKLDFKSFEDYLKHLKKKKRWDVRNKMKLFNKYGCDVDIYSNSEINNYQELFLLYKNTNNNNEEVSNIINYNQQTFNNMNELPDCYKWIFVTYKNQLVGFALLVEENEVLVFKHVGLDYKHSYESFAYFNLFYIAIQYGISKGYKKMYCGSTTYETKKRIGCSLIPNHAFISFKGKFFSGIVKKILQKSFINS